MHESSPARYDVSRTTALDPDHDASADDRCLTKDDVSTAVRELLRERLEANSSWHEAVTGVTVCGTRATVHLALQISGSDELLELDAAVARRLRQLGATEVEVVIRRPDRSSTGHARGRGDPWAGRVRLGTARHVLAVGAGKGGVGKSTIAVNLALALAHSSRVANAKRF